MVQFDETGRSHVVAGNGIDDPDQNFYENYVRGAEGNYIARSSRQ